MAKALKIQRAPSVKFIDSKQNSEADFGFTGHYDPEQNCITVYVTDRHDSDILRSFAHELIHHWQNERGTLQSKETPSPTSPNYAQEDQWLRKREMEAFLFSSLLFRAWQDENRYGPSQNPLPLPQPYD
jgi:hypothetical protein